MKKLFYPALFQIEENGYFVSFPDVEECLTEGDDMDTAYEMSVDALGLVLSYRRENNLPIPKPSLPQNIKTEKNQFIVVIEFDMNEYMKKHNEKFINKIISIPQWLDQEVIEKNINFSEVCQEALINKIQNNI